MYVLHARGGGSELKQTGERGSSLSVRSLCEKKMQDFQTADRLVSDKMLGSC